MQPKVHLFESADDGPGFDGAVSCFGKIQWMQEQKKKELDELNATEDEQQEPIQVLAPYFHPGVLPLPHPCRCSTHLMASLCPAIICHGPWRRLCCMPLCLGFDSWPALGNVTVNMVTDVRRSCCLTRGLVWHCLLHVLSHCKIMKLDWLHHVLCQRMHVLELKQDSRWKGR